MILYHHFLGSLKTYFELGKANLFPEFDQCPLCHAQNRLNRHGFYDRNAIDEEASYRIPICRLKCPDCKKTFSILPDFLLPYFQHTAEYIFHILLTVWIYGKCLCIRQLRRFYQKRCLGKLLEVELFFRETGHHERLPKEPIKKAIILLQMIQALESATFVRRWWSHRVNSPMAHLVYHGTRVAKTE